MTNWRKYKSNPVIDAVLVYGDNARRTWAFARRLGWPVVATAKLIEADGTNFSDSRAKDKGDSDILVQKIIRFSYYSAMDI